MHNVKKLLSRNRIQIKRRHALELLIHAYDGFTKYSHKRLQTSVEIEEVQKAAIPVHDPEIERWLSDIQECEEDIGTLNIRIDNRRKTLNEASIKQALESKLKVLMGELRDVHSKLNGLA